MTISCKNINHVLCCSEFDRIVKMHFSVKICLKNFINAPEILWHY